MLLRSSLRLWLNVGALTIFMKVKRPSSYLDVHLSNREVVHSINKVYASHWLPTSFVWHEFVSLYACISLYSDYYLFFFCSLSLLTIFSLCKYYLLKQLTPTLTWSFSARSDSQINGSRYHGLLKRLVTARKIKELILQSKYVPRTNT